VDHKIRYQTLHDNKYIRYFQGHSERVTGLCLSPKNDMFLSAGQVRCPAFDAPAPIHAMLLLLLLMGGIRRRS
jgi:hypothetical protein